MKKDIPNIIYCNDLENDYGCCTSCHEDDDLGYFDLMDIEPPKKRNNPNKIIDTWARVCCAHYDYVKNMTRNEWAKIIKKGRVK